ncbi:MAG TPA: 3,4-dihydroxy-2-butanone-4-phosphate synthase [Solirubrobacteraceae bacterium]|jgi:3,4-dihydroxy 2-butanone 4-phosphate synthase/GTP cyclohydrolase II|nr:3,4-dihydroxy-2-butanone-4-phosphate synthase [Solirubrobacteraceae bacterium]
MSALALSAERFADGEPVLVGGRHDPTIFVASAADTVTAARLERLHELGRGMVVLALDDRVADRLGLPEPDAGARPRVDVPFTASIDAASGISGGWSLRDRALTMRVATDPRTRPADLTIPGHVHPARIRDEAGAAAAALELARLSGRAGAVVLCAVLDRDGAAASLVDARQDAALRRLPVASSGELRGLQQARRINALAVSCALPTPDGAFQAVGHVPSIAGDATVVLCHGAVATHERPLVHIRSACLLGDVFGSLACTCRADLDAAVAAMIDEGAGVLVYLKPATWDGATCGRERPIDVTAAAGLLRRVDVTRMRLSSHEDVLGDELRALGFDVASLDRLA